MGIAEIIRPQFHSGVYRASKAVGTCVIVVLFVTLTDRRLEHDAAVSTQRTHVSIRYVKKGAALPDRTFDLVLHEKGTFTDVDFGIFWPGELKGFLKNFHADKFGVCRVRLMLHMDFDWRPLIVDAVKELRLAADPNKFTIFYIAVLD